MYIYIYIYIYEDYELVIDTRVSALVVVMVQNRGVSLRGWVQNGVNSNPGRTIYIYIFMFIYSDIM